MNGRTHYRGTILVVALGLLAALAIIGATMISVARVDRFASRSFRQSAELDMAVDGALVWIENELTNQYWDNIYWTKIGNNTVSFDGDGVIDSPALGDGKTRIAVVRPDTAGKIGVTTQVNPGLVKTSGGTSLGTWYNLPLKANLPSPDKSDTTGTMVPDGWVVPAMTYRTTRNRTIEVALTMVDLGARYNVNFHGDATIDISGGMGQSYKDQGYYLSDVAPNYAALSGESTRKSVGDMELKWRDVAFGSRGRWLSMTNPDSKNPDKTINFFNPGKDKPFLADDMMELLNLRGTKRRTRLEYVMPTTFSRDGEDSSASVDPMFYKALYTCYSWVSTCRPRISSDNRDAVAPKVDLDSCTWEEIREALLACGFRPDDKDEMILMDQILVNILDYRDQDGQPSYITNTTKDGTEYTVCGVDRQPFITEYYIKKERADRDAVEIPFRVFIELSNPYPKRTGNGITEKGLERSESYTRIEVGKASGKVTSISLPEEIDPAPDDGSCPVTIAVVDELIMVPRDETEPMKYLEPVVLFAKAKDVENPNDADKQKEIVIDRLTLKKTGGSYEEISTAESWQRMNRQGLNSIGEEADFFAGWITDYEKRVQTCSGDSLRFFNDVLANKKMRPIENRSMTKKEWIVLDNSGNRERGLHKAEELSFPRIGDLCRVLRVGHKIGKQADFSDYKPVTEEITAATNDEAGYVSPMGSTTGARAATLLQRVFDVITVNSPYYDGVDNDGDFDDKDRNNEIDKNEPVFDDKDTGFQVDAADNPIDALGPEIYEHGRINLRTAPPEVVRGLLPMQLKRKDKSLWTIAETLVSTSSSFKHPSDLLNVQVAPPWRLKHIFTKTGMNNDNWDDDDNGAPDDFAEQCHLYTFISNFATVRSDCYAVYGTARIKSDSGRTEGVRRFVAVLDRVPATAYPPFRYTGAENRDLSEITNFDDETLKMTPNPKFIPVRRVMQGWID
ncbi:MAG: hypothetical protein JXL80_02935 [Planctomycetes bacterium]|nr:hypothetical protein [Planctomycetota bacterium]